MFFDVFFFSGQKRTQYYLIRFQRFSFISCARSMEKKNEKKRKKHTHEETGFNIKSYHDAAQFNTVPKLGEMAKY